MVLALNCIAHTLVSSLTFEMSASSCSATEVAPWNLGFGQTAIKLSLIGSYVIFSHMLTRRTIDLKVVHRFSICAFC